MAYISFSHWRGEVVHLRHHHGRVAVPAEASAAGMKSCPVAGPVTVHHLPPHTMPHGGSKEGAKGSKKKSGGGDLGVGSARKSGENIAKNQADCARKGVDDLPQRTSNLGTTNVGLRMVIGCSKEVLDGTDPVEDLSFPRPGTSSRQASPARSAQGPADQSAAAAEPAAAAAGLKFPPAPPSVMTTSSR